MITYTSIVFISLHCVMFQCSQAGQCRAPHLLPVTHKSSDLLCGDLAQSDSVMTSRGQPGEITPETSGDMDPGQSDNEVLDIEAWTRDTEEVLSWLLEAEDHLVAVNSLGQKHLETVKTRFYNHEDFMLELKTHQSRVGEVSLLKGCQICVMKLCDFRF